ncbi:MAG: alpha/beta fold hydrolase [Anaerolineae bacterium]|nr:alpha/beta fold hydrolase [Anaerolineae bacterium]
MHVRDARLPRLLLILALLAALALFGCGAPATPEPTATPFTPEASPTAPAVATTQATPTVVELPQTPETAPPPEGRYVGAIEVGGQRIEIEIEFGQRGQELVATMDIPVQGAMDIPLNEVLYHPPEISFTAFSGNSLAAFAGQVEESGSISGTFVQMGVAGTFVLEPAPPVVEEPLPYREEEVVFHNGDITLAGTLSLPEGEGPFPAVVLISGSGAQNRDENILGFRIFFRIADHLTRNGIAVLRYDDRGVGGSTGDLTQATQVDLAGDVLAAVELLLSHAQIDPEAIGLIGHSEGGIVAPLVANRSENVSYLVLLAGPATPGEEILVDQLELIMRAQGATEEQIAAAKEKQQKTLEAVKTGEGWDEVRARSEAELRATIEALPEAQRRALGDVDEFVRNAVEAEIANVASPWFRSFVEYDPVPALRELDVPVLALFGELDTQVPPEKNAQAMREALEEAGLEDFRIEILASANHLFQEAVTGGVDEYATLEKEFVPGLLDLITEWILEHTS